MCINDIFFLLCTILEFYYDFFISYTLVALNKGGTILSILLLNMQQVRKRV